MKVMSCEHNRAIDAIIAAYVANGIVISEVLTMLLMVGGMSAENIVTDEEGDYADLVMAFRLLDKYDPLEAVRYLISTDDLDTDVEVYYADLETAHRLLSTYDPWMAKRFLTIKREPAVEMEIAHMTITTAKYDRAKDAIIAAFETNGIGPGDGLTMLLMIAGRMIGNGSIDEDDAYADLMKAFLILSKYAGLEIVIHPSEAMEARSVVN